MSSPQALTEADRRLVAAWAADCAERVLPLFETEAPGDDRPRDAIARARAFARGDLDAAGEIRRRFVAGRAAHAVTSAAAVAAARSAAQAAAVAHMGAHALGAAAYAVKAVGLTAPGEPTVSADEISWQVGRMSSDVRTVLERLPPVGEDPSGPLGSGLLASGVLGSVIRELQAAIGVEVGVGSSARSNDNPLPLARVAPDAGPMSDRDDINQPLDHLPPKEERGDDAAEIEEPHYPGTGGSAGDSPVSPETAAEPGKPDRHGVDKLPPTGR